MSVSGCVGTGDVEVWVDGRLWAGRRCNKESLGKIRHRIHSARNLMISHLRYSFICACSTARILILPKLSFNIFYSRQRMPIHPNLHISLSHTLRQPEAALLLPPSHWASAGKDLLSRFFTTAREATLSRYPPYIFANSQV